MVFQSNSFSSQPRAASGSKSTVLLARNLPSIPGNIVPVVVKKDLNTQEKALSSLPKPTPTHEFISALPSVPESHTAQTLGFQRHSPFRQELKTKSVPLAGSFKSAVGIQEQTIPELPPQFSAIHRKMSVAEGIKQTSPFVTAGATRTPRVEPPKSWVDADHQLQSSSGQPSAKQPVFTNFDGQRAGVSSAPSNSGSGSSTPTRRPAKKRSKKVVASVAMVAGLILAIWLTPASAWRDLEKSLIAVFDGSDVQQDLIPAGGKVAGATTTGQVQGLTTEFPNSQRLVISLPTVFRQAVVMAEATIQDLLNIEGDVNVGGNLAVDGTSELQGETTVGGAATFEDTVNIAGEVTLESDVTGDGITIDVGGGSVLASNLVYSVTAGDGISSTGGQNPQIVNTDRGSAQKIFGKVKVGTTTIEAGNNTDTLTLAGGTGVTLTPSTSGKSVTIDVSGTALNVSGFTDDGGTVRLTTTSDTLGIGTTTTTGSNKLSVVGNGDITGNLLVTGTLTVQSGSIVSGGINNQSGGITNAGAITGATGLTSSGTITFSGLSTGIVKSDFSGVLSSSAVNLGSADVTGTLGPTNGGTGIATYTTGDLIYGSGTNTLAKLAAGANGQVLTLASGVPSWASITGSGGLCSNCVVNDPASTQTITPTASTATGLSVRQAASGSVDIFNVASNNGSSVYFRVDSTGNVLLGSGSVSSGGVLTVGPTGTDPLTLSPALQGAGAFTGTITSADLTAARTWTFPNATGDICLSTGNCAGVGGVLGGSGTTGYVPRFDTSSTITNSNIFDDGTNIGISDITPSYKLDVNGTLRATGAGTFDTTLGVTGATTLSSTLQVSGLTSLLSTLNVSGATTLSSTLGVTGNTTLGGTLSVANNVTVDTNTFFVDTVANTIGVLDLTPDAVFDIDSSSGTTTMVGLTNTALTTADALDITTTYSGSSTTRRAVDLNVTSSGTSSTMYGIDLSLVDTATTTTGSTLYGINSNVSNNAVAGANSIGINVNSSGGGNGGLNYGILANSTRGSTTGSLTQYGGNFVASSNTSGITGSSVTAGIRTLTLFSGATSGTHSSYGILVEAPTYDNAGSGTHTAYGLYLGDVTGADTNYGLYSVGGNNYFGGNVGIGDTSPSSLLEVGNGTDSLQVSSVGDLTFVDADGAASITGPAGGTFSVNAGASQDLSLTAADDLFFDDLQLTSALQLSVADTALNVALTQGVVDAINDLYDLSTGGGGGSIWTLASGVVYPTSATNDFAVGGSTLAASMFGIDESAGNFFLGYDNSANPTLNFEATDGDAGEFGFNTNDAFYFSNANVGIGDTTPAALFTVGNGDLFQVNSTGNISNTYSSGRGISSTNSSTDIALHLINSAADGDPRIALDISGGNVWNIGANDGDGDKFMIGDHGGGTLDSDVHFTIDGSGNTGIGDTSPAALFTVGSGDLFQVNSSGNIANIGGAAHTIANSSGALAIDSATTGAINLGTSTNAKTITIGNATGATALNFNSGTGAQTFTSQVSTGTAFSFVNDLVTTGNGLSLSADALTTGRGLYLESTSTAFSSGSLGSLYWNPASATTATGDILTLDVGSNGIVGSILNVKNAGSSIFSVGQAQITSGVPHQFTAPGDVAIAYDLQFTNQTASYLKSYGPLYLEAGEIFESNDLTFKTYNSGNIIGDLTGTGAMRLIGTDTSLIFDTRTATDTDFWMGIVDDGGSDDDDTFRIGDGVTPGTNSFLTINTSGFTGIGNTAPAVRLHVGDSTIADATALLRLQDTNSTCDFTADSGSPSCGSDQTLKKNIASLDTVDLLAKVAALRPVSYNWQTDGEGAAAINGFIAQEVAAQFPDLVTERTWIDGTTRKFLNTGGLMPYVVGAIGEQQRQLIAAQVRLDEQGQALAAGSQAAVNADQQDQLTTLADRVNQLENQAVATQSGSVAGVTVINQTELDQDRGMIGSLTAVVAEWTDTGFLFIKEVIFRANTLFEGPVAFFNDAIFNGRLIVGNQDTAGVIEFYAGQTEALVAFEQAYDLKPIVTLTLEGDLSTTATDSASLAGTSYRLSDVTPTGFKVTLTTPVAADQVVTINWHALGTALPNVTQVGAPSVVAATGSGQVAGVASGSGVVGN